MPNILIRDVDEQLDKALRIRAVKHGHTRESEIKAILHAAVKRQPQKQPLSEALARIPKIDADFDELIKRSPAPSRPSDLGR